MPQPVYIGPSPELMVQVKMEPTSDLEVKMEEFQTSGVQEVVESDEEELQLPAGVVLPAQVFKEEVNSDNPMAHSTWQGFSVTAESSGSLFVKEPGEMPTTSQQVDNRIDEKQAVAEKIRSGEYILLRKERSRSKVWEKFSSVYDAVQRRYVGYVQCSRCMNLLSMKLGSGTTHLSRHVCKDGGEPGVVIMSRKVNNILLGGCLEKCVEMCVQDLVPFSVVAGKGFQALCQEFVKIGAFYGNINVTSVLPSADTLSQNVSVVAHRLRETVVPEILNAIRDGVCAMEVWMDNFHDVNHFIVTSQFITEDWKLRRHIFFTFQCPKQKDTEIADAIQETLTLKLSSLGIPPEAINKLTFVISNSHEVANRMQSAAHCINSVIKITFGEDILKTKCPEIWQCLRTARNVVCHLKKKGLTKQLESMAKQCVLPAWNFHVMIMEIVFHNYESLVKIFTEVKEERYLHGWNQQLVSEIMSLLIKFKEATYELQNNSYPTLHLVLVYIYELCNHCTPCPSDHTETVVFKREAKYHLQEIKTSRKHYIATFLCPHTRLLKQLDTEARGKVYEDVRDMCSEMHAHSASTSSQPLSKRSRFGAWYQHEEEQGSSFDEVALYLATGKQESEDPGDLLSWWGGQAKMFPMLSQVARKVLCIPATCSSNSQFSSLIGLFSTEKCNLISDRVSDLLFVHNKITTDGLHGQVENYTEERPSQSM